MPHRRVLVVGGGVSGLATAWYLARAGADVTVLEAGARPGGKVATRRVAGRDVDLGPDALLARSATVEKLVGDLGLLDRLSRPRSRRAFVWTHGALRPLPAMSLFGVPDSPLALVRTGILSPAGALRAAADVVLPRRRAGGDPTIAELLRPRLGAQVFDRLVEPMLGGVHAGRADRLSARSAVPDVEAVVARSRSVYLALRERRPARRAAAGAPPAGLGMVSFRGGLATLVDALVRTGPLDVRTGATAVALRRNGSAWVVELADGEEVAADDVVLATPAAVTAELLRPLAADAATALDDVPCASVATLALAYRRGDLPTPLDGTGFLVPPVDGRLVVGCTWSSAKWEHLAGGDVVVLRCSVGRDGDDRWTAMTDDALVAAVRGELAEAMGLRAEPVETVVQRWPHAMPQYTVGHANRVAVVDTRLAALPGVHVTGAAVRGVGLASCIASGERTASAVLARPVVPTPGKD